MGVMDERPPGSTGALPGTPQGLQLAALLSKMFGQPSPTAGAPAQQTPGIVGGAPPSLVGAPPVGANPGVPAANALAPAVVPSPTRQAPSPSPISRGPMEYASRKGRDAAVVSSGIENLSEAIHGFKSKKDADELAKAQNTMKIYQQASQLDPQTGLPVDPYTKHLYENDPKIVASWEKYLKLQFPRALADPGAAKDSKGKVPQGKPVIPQPQADPTEMLKQLVAQKMLASVRSGQLSPSQVQSEAEGATALTPEEWQKAMKEKYGLTPKLADVRADEKIQAEIDAKKAEVEKFKSEQARLDAETVRLGPNDPYRQAQIRAEKALATERLAQADKDLREATKSQGLQKFTTMRKSFDDIYSDKVKELTKSQAASMKERGKISTSLGLKPSVTLEQEAMQDTITAMSSMKSKIADMQDDVVAGKLTPSDALAKARRGAGLTADYTLWNGLPPEVEKAFPAKGVPDGTPLNDPNGVVQAVAEGGKWVAP